MDSQTQAQTITTIFRTLSESTKWTYAAKLQTASINVHLRASIRASQARIGVIYERQQYELALKEKRLDYSQTKQLSE